MGALAEQVKEAGLFCIRAHAIAALGSRTGLLRQHLPWGSFARCCGMRGAGGKGDPSRHAVWKACAEVPEPLHLLLLLSSPLGLLRQVLWDAGRPQEAEACCASAMQAYEQSCSMSDSQGI